MLLSNSSPNVAASNPFLSNNPFTSSTKRHHTSMFQQPAVFSSSGSVNSSVTSAGAIGLGQTNLVPSRLNSNNLLATNQSNSSTNTSGTHAQTLVNTTTTTTTSATLANANIPSDTNSDLATFREALIMHSKITSYSFRILCSLSHHDY